MGYRFVLQYSIKNSECETTYYNDEFHSGDISEEEAIAFIKRDYAGEILDLIMIYYLDSDVIKYKDLRTGEVVFKNKDVYGIRRKDI